jgi:HPt (histidine-containing phosphotransfer) domain-containing protein
MSAIPITIDLTYLYSLTGGDKAFEQMLLTGTVEDVDSKIIGLKQAWEAGNALEIRKNAHSLVSLAAIAGMPQVENWSRTIDQSFADGAFHPELSSLANNIIAGWPDAKIQLEEIMVAG